MQVAKFFYCINTYDICHTYFYNIVFRLRLVEQFVNYFKICSC